MEENSRELGVEIQESWALKEMTPRKAGNQSESRKIQEIHKMIKTLISNQNMNLNKTEDEQEQDDVDKKIVLSKNVSDLIDSGCGFEKEEIDGKTYLICSVCCGQSIGQTKSIE